MNPQAFFKLSYGLFVIATKTEQKMNGCIINTVTQVAEDPKRIIFAVNKQNLTSEMIQKAGIASISVLSESAPFSIFKNFGFQSGREADKFVGVPFALTKQELPYLKEHTNAYFDCILYYTMKIFIVCCFNRYHIFFPKLILSINRHFVNQIP